MQYNACLVTLRPVFYIRLMNQGSNLIKRMTVETVNRAVEAVNRVVGGVRSRLEPSTGRLERPTIRLERPTVQ
jgi:hypothetical protein